MKVIICGGRDYRLSVFDYQRLNDWAKKLPITEVIAGAARGADTDAAEWAERAGIPLTEFPADWGRYGRRAGYLRNQKMLDYGAEAVIAFPGGPGTEMMCRIARRAGVRVIRKASL